MFFFVNCLINIISEFQNYMINTLTHLRYDISGLINISQITHANVQSLMENQNQTSLPVISVDNFDIEALFPITNDDDLITIETKLQDSGFRSSLV